MADFHYVITIQEPRGRGTHTQTWGGIFQAGPGVTREQAYDQILSTLTTQPAGCVLFFSLEPNDLGV